MQSYKATKDIFEMKWRWNSTDESKDDVVG